MERELVPETKGNADHERPVTWQDILFFLFFHAGIQCPMLHYRVNRQCLYVPLQGSLYCNQVLVQGAAVFVPPSFAGGIFAALPSETLLHPTTGARLDIWADGRGCPAHRGAAHGVVNHP